MFKEAAFVNVNQVSQLMRLNQLQGLSGVNQDSPIGYSNNSFGTILNQMIEQELLTNLISENVKSNTDDKKVKNTKSQDGKYKKTGEDTKTSSSEGTLRLLELMCLESMLSRNSYGFNSYGSSGDSSMNGYDGTSVMMRSMFNAIKNKR